ncbi:HAD-IB family hydrolase [Legionella bononiensis]|uniref:HAD-IB family hydrolase n=1 Tax=Legionella bononiensis TaxID=2793102 RepID=A0ABS1WC25_9GAMM|nr:HAD-IB family hydrolase [Legionella bononiensis]MBL7479175.1 HAD-IB family hydrolase [Legionella bononiensis]MBL7526911.1 HAD-IB family hydrolase [Legionella bononiensis]MBL7563825.1 HAD-IB family hydrolase [Legionella bononiensis]
MSISKAIAAVEAGPKGPEIGAFFDFDGTLIDGYSAVPYYSDRIKRRQMRLGEAADIIRMAWRSNIDENEFATFIGKSIAEWAGHPEQEMAELWSRLFKSKIAGLLFPEAWLLVKTHQKMGHTVVIASSATRYQISPLAEALGVKHLLCTRVMVRDGTLTGGIEGAPFWGVGKADAVRDFAKEHRLDLARSYGYANGKEDIAFLKTVGHATVVNPKRSLLEVAQNEHWQVLRFATRRKASVVTRVRSLGAYSALMLTSMIGFLYGVTTGKKRKAAEWICTTSSDAMLAITGIHIEVLGERHLREHRPSVFVFNHQSFVDGYVLFSLLRQGITGVAKQEIINTPLIGRLLRGLDFAFIDRSNTCSAIEAMQPAVDRLRAGLSIAIAPEGTRSLTPKLGRFKKGAFHIAMQAGVPIVPVVIRNDYEVMVRKSLLFRPGTVQVCVLPPIDVTHWNLEDLDHHIAAVQELFQKTLDDWPVSES